MTRSFLAASTACLIAVCLTTISAHAQLGDTAELTDVQLLLLVVAVTVLAMAAATRALRRTQATLAARASIDPLSGLVNRRAFVEDVEARLARDERTAVLFIDLDRFKLVNDTLGHEVGDRLLRIIAERLNRCMSADESTLIARFGGDEFTASTSGSGTDVWTAAERLADRILDELSTSIALGDRTLSIDVSAGIAVGQQGDDADDLIAQADLAMFAAKGRGGSCASMFDETMRVRADRRSAIEAGLRAALESGGLRLDYQPIVPLRTGGTKVSRRCCAGATRLGGRFPRTNSSRSPRRPG